MVANNSILELAKQYLTFLKVAYITFEQFMNRLQALLDIVDYTTIDCEYTRIKLLNIRSNAYKYR